MLKQHYIRCDFNGLETCIGVYGYVGTGSPKSGECVLREKPRDP